MKKVIYLLSIVFLLLLSDNLCAGIIVSTKHNLSIGGPGPVKATKTTEICVFCHTPHNARPATPLWNRQDTGQTYNPFTSLSLNAAVGQPDGTSRLCLSCHDGTIAIGAVLNLPGVSNSRSLQMTDSGSGKLTQSGTLAPSSSGFTTYIGLNLQNDHPISFVYDATLASADGELQDPSSSSYVGIEVVGGTTYPLPLDANSKVQCTTCHDPHGTSNPKFLRMPIKQTVDTATEGPQAIICLNCHTKQDSKYGIFNWIGSAHQSSTVADETYKVGNYLGKAGAVWEDACLACHDTHTVEGSRRLLREGTDDINQPKQGGNPAIEETCYLCHTNSTDTILDTLNNQVPDIESEFTKTYHMPIVTLEQADSTTEAHDIKNSDMEEITTEQYQYATGVPNLGLSERHAECTDCHNPHRVIKNTRYDGTGLTTQATHEHRNTTLPHSNIASGVLAGSWGVDPDYTFASWDTWPINIQYNKRGTPDGVAPVDKEYQVCLKCHSSYAYGTTPPTPGSTGGNTPSGTNDLTQYTDQAKEFNPSNAGFHPVIAATGRTLSTRGITNGSPFLFPWSGTNGSFVGNQTMYCSDCHGHNTSGTGNNEPSPWGPHGSNNEFILLGNWDFNTGTRTSTGGLGEDLCFKCHDPNVYSYTADKTASGVTGFNTVFGVYHNLHAVHMGCNIGGVNEFCDKWEINNSLPGAQAYRITCMNCHAGVIHGFGGSASRKGYRLLVAIKAKASPCTPSTDPDNCIDPATSDEMPYRTSRTRLRVEDREGSNTRSGRTWGTSGNWQNLDCDAAMNGYGTIVGGCRP